MKKLATKTGVLAALVLLPGALFAGTMDEEIDYLLATVGDSDCTFIRNGKGYAAKSAQDHLQMKRKRGKRYYDSADEFIDRIASKSSFSGKPYLIQCGDDPEQTAAAWFTALLWQHRGESPD
jgi:serine/threonine protein phosphatase PrpC